MQKLSQHTAILIFSRTAREEAHVKQFGRHLSAAQNLKIAQLLIRRTRRMAKRTRLPVFTVSGAQQRGRTFGQRFTNAIADVFDKGYDQVITIGSDCPALTPQILLEAQQQLQRGKIVTGADHSGGIYFLGISRQHFLRQTLANIPWQSGQDFDSIRQYADQLQIELAAGSMLIDVDDARDLRRVIERGHTSCGLFKKLRQLLQQSAVSVSSPVWFPQFAFPNACGLRGPPVYPVG